MKFDIYYYFTEEPGPTKDYSDWQYKRVWHRTPSGQRRKVFVKSLSSKEQWRYMPYDLKLKRMKQGQYMAPKSTSLPQEEKRIFDVYFSADRKGGHTEFEEGKFVVGTDDSAKAIEIEKAGHKIAVAHGVPLNAFKKYYVYDDKKWKKFPEDLDDEKKFELIAYTDNDLYLVDLFSIQDNIQIELSDPVDREEAEE